MVGATKKLFKAFQKDIDAIRHSTLLDGDRSYVASAMQSTYVEAQITQPTVPIARPRGYKKSSAHLNRVNVVRQKLVGAEDSVFAAISDAAQKDFQQHIKAWEQRCQTRLEQACVEILDDFNGRFVVPEVKPETNEEAVDTMKAAAEKALDRIEGELKDYVDAFEAYEKSGGAVK